MILTFEEEADDANEPASPVIPTDWGPEAHEAYLHGYGQGIYDHMIRMADSAASSSAGPASSTGCACTPLYRARLGCQKQADPDDGGGVQTPCFAGQEEREGEEAKGQEAPCLAFSVSRGESESLSVSVCVCICIYIYIYIYVCRCRQICFVFVKTHP